MLLQLHATDADAHVYEDPFLLTKRAPDELRDQLPQEYGRALGYRFGNQIAHSTRGRWQAFEEGGWEGLRRHLEQSGGGSQVRSGYVMNDLFPGAARMSDGMLWEQRYPELPEHYDDDWFSPAFTVDMLSKQGFDRSYMYPSLGLYLPCFDGMGALGIEACKVYNDWLHDFCAYRPDFLQAVAMISLHDVDLAVAEARRVKDRGFKGVVLSRFPDGRTSADPEIEPFWTACEELELVIAFHPVTSNVYLDNQPLPTPSSPFQFFNCNMFAEHFANMLVAGVLERHPDLTIALLESGCGWLPSVLWRLDRMFYSYRTVGGVWSQEIPRLLAGMDPEQLAANVAMPPVDYFRRQCYIACEAEPFIQDVADYIGADRIVFQGDFPHPDHHPSYIDELTEIVPRRLLRKILWDNPLSMYRDKV